jgi:hypothetical protein
LGGASVHLHPSVELRHMAAHGAVARWERRRQLGRPKEEEGGRRVGHGPEWPGGLNASWVGAERKQ